MDGISLLATIPFDNIRGLTWGHDQQIENGDTLGQASHIWRTKHKGLRMSYNIDSKQLRIRGSLQTFLKGNNYSGFTYREFAESVGSLADVLNCKPVKLAVINSEISATITHTPIHTQLKSLDNKAFLGMVKKGTNIVYGAECLRTFCGAKVYNKTQAERLRSSKSLVPDNRVQVELLARRNGFYLGNGFNLALAPNLKDLLNLKVYRNSNKLLIDMTKRMQIDGIIDWGYLIRKHGLSPSEFGKVLTIHDPNTSAFLKENNFQTWKKNKQVYDKIKTDLSADAASTSERFQQAVIEAVEQKF